MNLDYTLLNKPIKLLERLAAAEENNQTLRKLLMEALDWNYPDELYRRISIEIATNA